MDRNTIQCGLVRQAVAKLDHPTAEEVYANIAAAHPTVGKCTVYRNLKKLCDNGELIRIALPNVPDRFDNTLKKHFHAKCTSCGKLTDIMLEEEPVISTANGFCVTGFEIFFTGLCSGCIKTNDKEI